MDEVKITPTSQFTAPCSDILLREKDKVRLVFRPELVKNPNNAAASVHGRFLYQKKRKGDQWVDFDSLPLTSIKCDEGFQLTLDAAECFELRKCLYELAHVKFPKGASTLVPQSSYVGQFLAATESDLQAALSADEPAAMQALVRIVRWMADRAALEAPDYLAEFPMLNGLIGLANLRAAYKRWTEHRTNDDEQFWQTALEQHSFVLSQIFAYPIVVIKTKAYLGGKDLTNKHGALADFVAQIPSSGCAVIVEIKTPLTQLLGKAYRDDIFGLSAEVSGAISQVLHYRDTFMMDFHAVTKDDPRGLSRVQPKCVVIAGSFDRELKSGNQKRSFERLRDSFSGVTLLTYDELFGRVRNLIGLLEDPDPKSKD